MLLDKYIFLKCTMFYFQLPEQLHNVETDGQLSAVLKWEVQGLVGSLSKGLIWYLYIFIDAFHFFGFC